ncbi:unnamed protein product [Prorocentrum cordatum]|uniref:ATP-dependent transporter ycf16 n=1 Tax=Prorocentrum cordatum TaxID=2364126 RepID=A0ABN9SEW8_9DINO|nr:unnamed protein product [Polarella glacialis]
MIPEVYLPDLWIRNHLDLETIEGLAMALNKFEGGVVLVSHDDRLVSMVADELWVVMPGPNKEHGPAKAEEEAVHSRCVGEGAGRQVIGPRAE